MRTTSILRIPEPVPVVGFGCWSLSGPDVWTGGDDKATIAAARPAVDLGINLFYVAPVYGLGQAERCSGGSSAA